MSRAYNQALNNQAPNIPSLVRALQRSIAYHKSIQGSKQYDVIDSYRKEIDPSEWDGAPLLLSYQLMNWAIKKINKNNNARRGIATARANYLPDLLKENGLKQSQINKYTLENQVTHAKILDDTLHTFPRLEENKSMTVYRGESCISYYYQKASRMEEGDELVILPFLSTSINRYVAGRFGVGDCMWEIRVLPGQIFPYVSESIPVYLGVNNGLQNEQEVLFPTHARLRLINKSVDQVPKIYRFELVGFAEKSPDFWDKTLANLLSVLPQAPVLRRSERLNPRKPSGGGSKRNIRKTRRRSKNNRKSHRKVRK